jgi:hypothetical protein
LITFAQIANKKASGLLKVLKVYQNVKTAEVKWFAVLVEKCMEQLGNKAGVA